MKKTDNISRADECLVHQVQKPTKHELTTLLVRPSSRKSSLQAWWDPCNGGGGGGVPVLECSTKYECFCTIRII